MDLRPLRNLARPDDVRPHRPRTAVGESSAARRRGRLTTAAQQEKQRQHVEKQRVAEVREAATRQQQQQQHGSIISRNGGSSSSSPSLDAPTSSPERQRPPAPPAPRSASASLISSPSPPRWWLSRRPSPTFRRRPPAPRSLATTAPPSATRTGTSSPPRYNPSPGRSGRGGGTRREPAACGRGDDDVRGHRAQAGRRSSGAPGGWLEGRSSHLGALMRRPGAPPHRSAPRRPAPRHDVDVPAAPTRGGGLGLRPAACLPRQALHRSSSRAQLRGSAPVQVARGGVTPVF